MNERISFPICSNRFRKPNDDKESSEDNLGSSVKEPF